jgi:hypothetical protein
MGLNPYEDDESRIIRYYCLSHAWRGRFANEPAAPDLNLLAIQVKVIVI